MAQKAGTAKMRTSARNNTAIIPVRLWRGAQSGVALIELLITLSVLSFATLIGANAMNAALPQRALQHSAELLIADLKAARLAAQKTGEEVSVKFESDEYSVEGGGAKTLPRGMTMLLEDAVEESIIFTRRFANPGGKITLSKGAHRAIIQVYPITGKVERVE